MNEAELDIIDLNDWILFNHPDVSIIWREDGCLEIREL